MPFPQRQQGLTLIELLVGLTVGLLVIAAATVALMASRGISGTVSDVSGLQQQAAYAFRVIGMQFRQAGSLYLNPNPTNNPSGTDPLLPVIFETDAKATNGGRDFSQDKNILSIDSGTKTLTTGYRRYKDSVFEAPTPQALGSNCVGGPAQNSYDQRFESIFQLSGTELQCGGNGTNSQPILQNVAEMQVRYLVQNDTSSGAKILYAGTAPSEPRTVQGIEVCLVLYGTEPIDMPSGSSYTDCSGNSVAMDTLSGNRTRRLHMAFRSVYQLRSQGLL